MRLSIILLIMLSISLSLDGQYPHDNQWLIRAGNGVDGQSYNSPDAYWYNTYNSNINTNSFFYTTSRPAPCPNDLPNNVFCTDMKDRFTVILVDGSYKIFESDASDNGQAIDFDLNAQPLYMYHTRIYHDDDPDEADIITSTIPSNWTIEPTTNTPISTIFTQQDILPGDDLLVIINPPSPNSTMELSLEDNGTGLSLIPQELEYNSNKNCLIKDGGIISALQTTSLSSSSAITLPAASGPVYLNFRPQFNASAIGNSIILKVNEEERVRVGIQNKFHDPNFIEVQCVWKECDEYYVRYHVECYNDKPGGMGISDLKFNLGLPSAIDPNSIEIHDWMVGCKTGCEQPVSSKVQTTTHTSKITHELKVDFEPTLNIQSAPRIFHCDQPDQILSNFNEAATDLNECCHRAWFEFCAKLYIKEEAELNSVLLMINNPTTYFDNMSYPIKEFIDPTDRKTEEDSGIRISNTKCGQCDCYDGILGPIRKVWDNWFQSVELPNPPPSKYPE